jgi:hypothetical protein
MDHYASGHDLTHPWRTRTMVVSAIAAVELVALVAVGVVLLGKGWFQSERASAVHSAAQHHTTARTTTTAATTTHKTTPPPAQSHPAAPAKPLLPRARTTVLVLNGNGVAGAAGAEARLLQAHGYPVSSVGNAKRSDYATSIVLYRPGYAAEAQRLARDAHIGQVSPIDGLRPSQLGTARVAVIVGN